MRLASEAIIFLQIWSRSEIWIEALEVSLDMDIDTETAKIELKFYT